MFPILLWMVTSFDNVSRETKCDEQTGNWNRFSLVFHLFLPMAGLVLLLKQKNIFTRLLLQLDRNCVSVFCPSFSRREKLLKWAGSRLPSTWSSSTRTLAGGVSELWSDGSLLCTLINTVIPGACPNPHRHWRKPPLHAQAIAYKYLSVIPIFTEPQLSGSLTIALERNFLRYLTELQQSVIKLTETNKENQTYSAQFVARGMGLYSGEQHKKTVFFVYPNAKCSKGINSTVIIHIRGPYGTYGRGIIPKFRKALFTTPEINVISDSLSTKKILQKKSAKPINTFMRSFSIPFMRYHKKHMGDNIIIDVTMEDDRARITYIPKNYGMYDINLISDGELLSGCPFNVHIFNNTSGVEDRFDIEEKVEKVSSFRRRKVISKTIDFIDEQMPLSEYLKKYKKAEDSNNERNVVPDTRSTKTNFNFEEVVNAITKNGAVFRDMDVPKYSTNDKNKIINDNSDSKRTTIANKKTCDTEEFAKEMEMFKIQLGVKKIDEEEEDELSCDDIKINKNDLIYNDSIFKVCEDETRIGFTTSKKDVPEEHLYFYEKQNLESVSENDKSKLQEISKEVISENTNIHNNNTASTHGRTIINNVLTFSNLKANNEKIESTLMDTDVKVLAVLNNQEHKVDNKTNNCSTKTLTNDISRKTKVHKIQIPAKFSEYQNKIMVENLDTKYFKNELNKFNKNEPATKACFQSDKRNNILNKMPAENKCFAPQAIQNKIKSEDLNNNRLDKTEPTEIKKNLNNALTQSSSIKEVKKINITSRRFFPPIQVPLEKSEHITHPLETSSITSPICPDHIVPEVESEFQKLSTAEKRKVFAKKVPVSTASISSNSSFSEAENAEVSKDQRHFHFEGLSVLNVLGSLKESQGSKTNLFLSTTTSLPNIPSFESENIFQNSVKKRKDFWEKVSSKSSSFLSIQSDVPLMGRARKMTQFERDRLIWKRSSETTVSATNLNQEYDERSSIHTIAEIYKSADDPLFMGDYISHQTPKKFRSVDNSLDDCTVLSIEERKRLLLKQNYEKERIDKEQRTWSKKNSTKNLNGKNIYKVSRETVHNDRKNEIEEFSPVLDRIKKYNETSILPNTKEGETKDFIINKDKISQSRSNVIKHISKNSIHNNLEEFSPSPKPIKSHFKRAIKYFQNLEEKSLGKTRSRTVKKDCKSYSLDIKGNKRKKRKKGGSLNLQNISERFFIGNLYDDVFGNKKSGFRGAANRSAVVDALATFSRTENKNFSQDDEDDIKYEIFRKKAKTRQRKSIRSIFDVYY